METPGDRFGLGPRPPDRRYDLHVRRFSPALLAAVALAGCASSAPHTIPAAAINTGLALGVSAAQRSAGGCYATCTGGTVCNPRTGLCEAAVATEVCQEAPGGGVRCVPVEVSGAMSRKQPVTGLPTGPIGISPVTGSTPPAPSEASPRNP